MVRVKPLAQQKQDCPSSRLPAQSVVRLSVILVAVHTDVLCISCVYMYVARQPHKLTQGSHENTNNTSRLVVQDEGLLVGIHKYLHEYSMDPSNS